MKTHRTGLHFYLALRSLWRTRLSSLLMISAVAFGVGFQIPNSANLEGYTHELVTKGIVRATGHILVTPQSEQYLSDVSSRVKALESLDGVHAVSPRLVHAGVMLVRGRHHSSRIVGINPLFENTATGFCGRLGEGKCFSDKSDREILVGEYLARTRELEVGQRLKLTLPYEDLGEIKLASRYYTIVGILGGGGGFEEDKDIFMKDQVLETIIGRSDSASALLLFSDTLSKDQLSSLCGQIESRFDDVKARPWWLANNFVASAVKGNQRITTISLFMVIVAVMIPVMSLLYITVLRDRKKIGALRALGFSRLGVFHIYTFKACWVAVIGVGLGVAVGLAIARVFESYPIFSYGGFVIKPKVTEWAVMLPAVGVFVVTVLAGVFPAIFAARANPVDELRRD